MPVLNLKQFVKTAGTYSKEEADKIIESASFKMMRAGTHEVKIKEFKELKDEAGNEGKLVLAPDTNWIKFAVVLVNAAEASQTQTFMFPAGNKLQYKNPTTGKETAFVYQKFVEFIAALGFECEGADSLFIRTVINNSEKALQALIGAQLKIHLFWEEGTCHPEYDSNTKSYFICDHTGKKVCEEPFNIAPEAKGAERWAEMVKVCSENSIRFNNNMSCKLLPNTEVKNELGFFTAKPAPATLSKPAKSEKVAEYVEAIEEDETPF